MIVTFDNYSLELITFTLDSLISYVVFTLTKRDSNKSKEAKVSYDKGLCPSVNH